VNESGGCCELRRKQPENESEENFHFATTLCVKGKIFEKEVREAIRKP
jgi:hypothetical protein